MFISQWHGFKKTDFIFENMRATVVSPETANKEKNWLLKTEYFDAFPGLEIEMLKLGWHISYIENVTRWCLEEIASMNLRTMLLNPTVNRMEQQLLDKHFLRKHGENAYYGQ